MARTGKPAYIVDRDTDRPIATRRSVTEARRVAAEHNESVGRIRYRAESCESFRSNVPARRPTLRAAIEWLAANDNPKENDLGVIATQATVALVADLFGKTPGSIAVRVVLARRKQGT